MADKTIFALVRSDVAGRCRLVVIAAGSGRLQYQGPDNADVGFAWRAGLTDLGMCLAGAQASLATAELLAPPPVTRQIPGEP